jgi:hypothetical protein
LTQDVIDGIAPFGFCPLDKRLAEADLFDLFGGDIMLCNMVYSVFWPDQLVDAHDSILREDCIALLGVESHGRSRGAIWPEADVEHLPRRRPSRP